MVFSKEKRFATSTDAHRSAPSESANACTLNKQHRRFHDFHVPMHGIIKHYILALPPRVWLHVGQNIVPLSADNIYLQVQDEHHRGA